MERALDLGLPLLGPIDEPLPPFASSRTRQRGRTGVDLFADINPDVIRAVRAAASARGAHVWWVAQEALRLGVPLLPAPNEVLLPTREELLRSA